MNTRKSKKLSKKTYLKYDTPKIPGKSYGSLNNNATLNVAKKVNHIVGKNMVKKMV
jgi:hypothetical protein